MWKYILITVVDRDISISFFSDYQSAYSHMLSGLEKAFENDLSEYKFHDDYRLNMYKAWANNDSEYDWSIERIPPCS